MCRSTISPTRRLLAVRSLSPNASDLTKFHENGLWMCHICPNRKYLFVFELFDHWREIHPKDFVVSIGTKLEDKLFENCEKYSETTFDRDLLLFQDGYWDCPLCQNQGNMV